PPPTARRRRRRWWRRSSSAAAAGSSTNRPGRKRAGGAAPALADASRRGGRALDGDFGLFEVDEFWLGEVVEELNPRAMLLANLFRDQLHRSREPATAAAARAWV